MGNQKGNLAVKWKMYNVKHTHTHTKHIKKFSLVRLNVKKNHPFVPQVLLFEYTQSRLIKKVSGTGNFYLITLTTGRRNFAGNSALQYIILILWYLILEQRKKANPLE